MKTNAFILSAIVCVFSNTASHVQEAVIPATEPVFLADITTGV